MKRMPEERIPKHTFKKNSEDRKSIGKPQKSQKDSIDEISKAFLRISNLKEAVKMNTNMKILGKS